MKNIKYVYMFIRKNTSLMLLPAPWR